MILHRLSHTDNQLRSTEKSDLDVLPIPGLLANVIAGHCTLIDGAWIFGERVWTKSDQLRPVSGLRMVAHLTPKSGAPGSCDLHTIEAWDGDEMVMRSGCAIAEGIDVQIPTIAGHAG